MKDIKVENKFIVKNEEIRIHDTNNVSSTIMTFSIASLIILLMTGLT